MQGTRLDGRSGSRDLQRPEEAHGEFAHDGNDDKDGDGEDGCLEELRRLARGLGAAARHSPEFIPELVVLKMEDGGSQWKDGERQCN